MAITVRTDWKGRGASTNDKGERTLRRSWTVQTDDDLTGEPAVIDAVVAFDASAALYAPHPDWAWAVCRSLKADPNGGPRVWKVTAEYSSAPFGASGDGSGTGGNGTAPGPGQSNQTPAHQRPPTITVNRKEITKPLERDVLTGARVVNVVGDPFDPPPEVFRSHHLITFKFHRRPQDLNWSVRSGFMDSLNQGDFLVLGRVYPPLTLRCTDYAVGAVWETGQAGMELYFELTVQLEYNPDGWQPQILNTGRRKRVPASGGAPGLNPEQLVAIVDRNGQPVADPVPLTAAGVPVEPGGAFHYVTPAGYRPQNWATILA